MSQMIQEFYDYSKHIWYALKRLLPIMIIGKVLSVVGPINLLGYGGFILCVISCVLMISVVVYFAIIPFFDRIDDFKSGKVDHKYLNKYLKFLFKYSFNLKRFLLKVKLIK